MKLEANYIRIMADLLLIMGLLNVWFSSIERGIALIVVGIYMLICSVIEK